MFQLSNWIIIEFHISVQFKILNFQKSQKQYFTTLQFSLLHKYLQNESTEQEWKSERILVFFIVLVLVLTNHNFCPRSLFLFFIKFCVVLRSRSCWFLIVNSTSQILEDLTKSSQINEKIDENGSRILEKSLNCVYKLQEIEELSAEIQNNGKRNEKTVVLVLILVLSNDVSRFFLVLRICKIASIVLVLVLFFNLSQLRCSFLLF